MALDYALESRAQKPSDLLHSSGNLSELLTCISAGWLNCKLKFYGYLFPYLSHCIYFLTSTVKRCLLNAKNGLDLYLGTHLIRLHFFITVKEYWSKRYVCIAYSLGNILGWYFLVIVTFLYLAHFAQSILRACPINKIKWEVITVGTYFDEDICEAFHLEL